MASSITHTQNKYTNRAQKNRRTQYLVDKKLQLSMAGSLVLAMGICVVITALMVGWFFCFSWKTTCAGMWTMDI